jgi:hypothetical protein
MIVRLGEQRNKRGLSLALVDDDDDIHRQNFLSFFSPSIISLSAIRLQKSYTGVSRRQRGLKHRVEDHLHSRPAAAGSVQHPQARSKSSF